VDFDRALPPASPLRDYLRLPQFRPRVARAASSGAHALVNFLFAAADPRIRADRAGRRRAPLLCALAFCDRKKPPAGLPELCVKLATKGAEKALDGALWRVVVSFL